MFELNARIGSLTALICMAICKKLAAGDSNKIKDASSNIYVAHLLKLCLFFDHLNKCSFDRQVYYGCYGVSSKATFVFTAECVLN